MSRKLIILVVLLLASIPAFAQTVDTAWVRRHNGLGNSGDYAYTIAVDDSGNVYVAGQSVGSGTNDDYATIKYDPDGDTAWVRRYNGPGNGSDYAYAIAVDDSNNVYVTGGSVGDGTGNDCATMKYYPNGDTAWVRRYDGPESSSDEGRVIAVDDSGNVYVTGRSYGSGTNYDYATIKYHPDGDTAWVRRYNGPGDNRDEGKAIAVDGSGNVYVTGYSYGGGTSYDYATIKYSPDGDTAWVRRYNEPGNNVDEAYAIAVDDLGNVYVTGRSYRSGSGEDYATIKYHPNGDTAWARRYNGPANDGDVARAIAVDGSGNVYVTGRSDSAGSYQDYATIKYDSNGNQVWVRRYDYGVTGTDDSYDIAIDVSNNVYVTGVSAGGGAAGLDYATIKYYSNGDNAWVMRHNGPGNGSDYAQAVAVDDSGNVYVTGYSYDSGTDFDYATIKYVQGVTDVKDETGGRERPSEFDLSQNYPNPFNPTTKIEFTLAKSGFVSLQIYDVLGRKVRTLVSEELSSGYKSVLWDGKNDEGKGVASGVYFYQLKVGDFSEPKKMLLLK
jgi:uncharacterized delta-60 repeat protein